MLYFITLLCSSGCGLPGSSWTPESEYVLGTFCTISLFEQGEPRIYSEAFSRLRELEDIFSANREGTDLDLVNKNAGLSPVKVRPALILVLEKAIHYAEKSGGAFDPSIGPLVKLWGIGTDGEHVPGNEEIRNAMALVDFREIIIDQKEGTVFLERPGMALDLGAIAKGYAADEMVALLAGEGIERAIIDLGGNIFAMGEKKAEKHITDFLDDLLPGSAERKIIRSEESYWRIGIQDPRENRGNYLGILKVKNKTIVTSGMYERFFEENGIHYHHILSTETGFPVDNNLLSVTIVADRSIDADALSTAAFALGWEKGRGLISSVNGAEAIFVFNDLTVRLTSGLENNFTLTALEYRLDKK